VQLGRTGVSLDPAYTKANQSAANMLAEISAAVTNPNEKKSVNDVMAELTIMMLKHSLANKNVEREMRTEIAQIQYQNGMKIADLIKQKGEMAFKKALTQAVTQLTSAVVSLGAQKLTEHLMTREKGTAGIATDGKAAGKDGKIAPTDHEKSRAQTYAGLVSNVARESVSCIGNLIGAEFDLGISKIDAERQVIEITNKLLDSISSSVDSSIRSQESAIQFAMSMLQQLNSLAADGCNKIINNMR
jgi:hypothetical protein